MLAIGYLFFRNRHRVARGDFSEAFILQQKISLRLFYWYRPSKYRRAVDQLFETQKLLQREHSEQAGESSD